MTNAKAETKALQGQINFVRRALHDVRVELDELRWLRRNGVDVCPESVSELRDLFHAGHQLLRRLERNRRAAHAPERAA